MATTTTIRTPASTVAPLIVIKGKGKAAREEAFYKIAPYAFSQGISRKATIDNLRIALGTKPTDDEIKVARIAWQGGILAAELPVAEFPSGTIKGEAEDAVRRLDHGEALLTTYAQPKKEGSRTKLPKGKIGYRSLIQQKMIGALGERWSQLLAELGLNAAKTQGEKNKAKATRSTNDNPVRGAGKAGSDKGEIIPTHAQLVQPDEVAAVTPDVYVQHMLSMLNTLVSYDKKNAKKRPTTHGAFVESLIQTAKLAASAASDYQLRKDEALAKAAA